MKQNPHTLKKIINKLIKKIKEKDDKEKEKKKQSMLIILYEK